MTVGNAVGAGEGRDVTKTSFLPRVKKGVEVRGAGEGRIDSPVVP